MHKIKQIALLMSIPLHLFAKVYSFDSLLELIKKNSIELKIHDTEMLIQKIEIDKIKSNYLPKVYIQGYSEYNKDLSESDNEIASVGSDVITNYTQFQNALSLKLDYLLYDFGKKNKKIENEEIKYKIKKLEKCLKYQSLAEKTLDIYKQILTYRIEINYYQELLKLKKEIYVLKQRLYKAGEISKVELADLAIEILTLENELRNKKEEYETLLFELSKHTGVRFSVEDNFREFLISPKPINMDFTKSVKYRLSNLKIKQKEKELEIIKLNKLPTVSMYASYNLYGQDRNYVNSLENIRQNSYKIGIAFKMDIYDGNINDYEKKKTALEIKKLKLQQQLEKREFANKIAKLRKNLEYLYSINSNNYVLKRNIEISENMQNRLNKVKKIDTVTHLQKKISLIKQKLQIDNKKIELGYYLKKIEVEERLCTRR